mgnify:CR=1 FL=1
MHVFDSREKIALFIDGANLYATSRNLGFDIDYKKPVSYTNLTLPTILLV